MRETMASFRMTLLPVFACVSAWALVLGVAVFLIRGRFDVQPSAVMAGITAGEAFGLVATICAIAYFRLYVGSWGLRGFDFWGLYHDVAWTEMVAVKPCNFLGLPFLRVPREGNRRPLWVPLFLADNKRFANLVHEFAGPVHPLTRALLEKRS